MGGFGLWLGQVSCNKANHSSGRIDKRNWDFLDVSVSCVRHLVKRAHSMTLQTICYSVTKRSLLVAGTGQELVGAYLLCH